VNTIIADRLREAASLLEINAHNYRHKSKNCEAQNVSRARYGTTVCDDFSNRHASQSNANRNSAATCNVRANKPIASLAESIPYALVILICADSTAYRMEACRTVMVWFRICFPLRTDTASSKRISSFKTA
jgi:hypothetical protein